jgi:predicted NAD-dependent protein-ADP-ribosyltransferase YbiA (DUF1768 family)
MEVITFFDKKKEYRCLSNFWEGLVRIVDGEEVREYGSGELAFHGEKYVRLGKLCKDENRKMVLLEYGKKFLVDGEIKSSKDAKSRGGKGKNGLRLNSEELKLWSSISVDVQIEICRWKLENSEDVMVWLKKSGSCFLVHPAMRCKDEKMKDKFWEGRVVKGENGEMVVLGGNKLGEIWMRLRDEL